MVFGRRERQQNRHRPAVTLLVWLFIVLAAWTDESAYAATNDKLDINLNVIYVSTRSQKGSNALGETIIQFPFPLTDRAQQTGQGLFGGITYFDTKTLVSDATQLVNQVGFGRIYYSTTVPGETPHTFVPFVTFYRQFVYDYQVPGTTNNIITQEATGNEFMLPGAFYAYRFTEKYAFHWDTELYSYREMSNVRTRLGFTYTPVWPWIISSSFEHLSWDIDATNANINGSSNLINFKIIFRDPPQGNFALTVGYGRQYRFATGANIPVADQFEYIRRGLYVGVEASGGVLAW